MRKTLFIVLAAAATLVACQKQASVVSVPDGPIRFSVDNTFSFTKATESAFEDADEIQIIAGSPISSASKGTVSGSNLTLTPAMYWAKGQSEAATFVAIYPYTSVTNTSFEYDLNYGGNHDFAYHKNYLVAKASSAPTEDKVALAFRHPFSKVLINVDNQLGSDEVASVVLKTIKMAGTLDLVAETVDVSEVDATDVTAAKLSDTQWGVIVMPQSARPTLEVTTTLGSKYTFTLPANFTFEAGKVTSTSVVLQGQGGSGDSHGAPAAFSFSVTNWTNGAQNPGFESGAVAMGSYWYVLGCVYQADNTVAAWGKDFPMVYGGKNAQDKEIWTITVNYDEAKATKDVDRGFKLRRYDSDTAEADMWSTQLGMYAEDSNEYMNIDYTYDLHSTSNKNIRFEEAGNYTLTLTGNTLSVVKN
jgi:hypothetical protein